MPAEPSPSAPIAEASQSIIQEEQEEFPYRHRQTPNLLESLAAVSAQAPAQQSPAPTSVCPDFECMTSAMDDRLNSLQPTPAPTSTHTDLECVPSTADGLKSQYPTPTQAPALLRSNAIFTTPAPSTLLLLGALLILAFILAPRPACGNDNISILYRKLKPRSCLGCHSKKGEVRRQSGEDTEEPKTANEPEARESLGLK